jgi:hypothetical protein
VRARYRVLGVMLALIASGCGQQGPARVRAFAQLPDWNGIWMSDDGVMSNLELSGYPAHLDLSRHILSGKAPFTTAWESKVVAFHAAITPTSKDCGFYFPLVMESPWMFEVLITPEETAMIFAGREVRHIYTDGRRHLDADSIWATPWGDSVGRWEGDVLVVETFAVQPSHFPAGPLLSDQARFTERIRMVAPDRIEDDITISDPIALTRPWRLTLPYRRTSLDRLMHGDCLENDRNPVVSGKLTIAPAH